MMSLIHRWLRGRAITQMATRLPPALVAAYGGADDYTKAQVDTVYAQLRLPLREKGVAYARFLTFENYTQVTGGAREAFDEARDLFHQYAPDHVTSEWEPAPVNEYVRQLGGGP